MHNGWKEAEERVIRLPEDSPEYFEAFARFVYTGNIYTHEPSEATRDEYVRLTGCWALGEKIGSVAFKDAIADAICDTLIATHIFSGTSHERIYPVSYFFSAYSIM